MNVWTGLWGICPEWLPESWELSAHSAAHSDLHLLFSCFSVRMTCCFHLINREVCVTGNSFYWFYSIFLWLCNWEFLVDFQWNWLANSVADLLPQQLPDSIMTQIECWQRHTDTQCDDSKTFKNVHLAVTSFISSAISLASCFGGEALFWSISIIFSSRAQFEVVLLYIGGRWEIQCDVWFI